ncbi:MAG TPA: hypothetical protein VKH81_07745 [Candidatus Angelobacter sp.]|nr:hypothetical protein [Candidatus Angelobacter sp.]
MIFKTRLASALLVAFLALGAVGQSPESVRGDVKHRVLDLLFRPDAVTSPFLSKLTLRFGDSDSQLVVLIYPVYPVHPGGQVEVISYTIIGMGNDDLSQFIARMTAQNPDVTEQEIAAKLKVDIKRSSMRYEGLSRDLDDLKAIRISPVLASRVALDKYFDYEFWYNSGQESVHYLVTGPFKGDPQDKLVQWMIKFRTRASELTTTPSANP